MDHDNWVVLEMWSGIIDGVKPLYSVKKTTRTHKCMHIAVPVARCTEQNSKSMPAVC